VEELVIVDPQEKTVSWAQARGSEYQHEAKAADRARATELAERIDWS
jgi:hypothetical protein